MPLAIEVGSGGLGCHDDHSRLLGQPRSRVEQAHHPVLHHPDDGHGMAPAPAKMPLKGARLLAGRAPVKGATANSGRKLRVIGNQPGTLSGPWAAAFLARLVV